MKKQTRIISYLERIYPKDSYRGGFENIERLGEVEFREPLAVAQELDLTGFRFFDICETRKSDELRQIGDACNYSKTFYFGQRVSREGLSLMNVDDPMLEIYSEYLERNGLDSAIFCDNGEIIDNPQDNDMTISEVKAVLIEELSKSVDVEHNKFFKGLAAVLKTFEREVTYMEDDKICPVEEKFIDDEEIVRSYSIYVGNDLTVNYPTILAGGKVGTTGVKTYFSLDEAISSTNSLYNEYPYLKPIMDKVRLEVLANGSSDIANKMIDVAIEYAGYGSTLNKTTTYTKK